jgi:hypothetical protein
MPRKIPRISMIIPKSPDKVLILVVGMPKENIWLSHFTVVKQERFHKLIARPMKIPNLTNDFIFCFDQQI